MTGNTPELSSSKKLIFAGFTVLAVIGLTVAIDRVLGLMGFAGQEAAIAPPPNYTFDVVNNEYEYTIRTNDRGIRYRSIPLEKPEGTFRIVVLGDSSTEGTGVENEFRWTNLVENELRGHRGRKVEMINCAEAGTNVIDYGEILFHVCFDYDPDLVLIAFHINDVSTMPTNLSPSVMFPSFENPGRTPMRKVVYALWPHVYTVLRAHVIPLTSSRESDLLSTVESWARRQHIDDEKVRVWRSLIPDSLIEAANAGRIIPADLTHPLFRPGHYQEALDLDTDEAKARFESLKDFLDVIVDESGRRGVETAVILIPTLYQYDSASDDRLRAHLFAAMGAPMRSEWKSGPTNLEIAFQDWSSTSETAFLDLSPVFRDAARAGKHFNFAFDVHWTKVGHQVAAAAVGRWLSAEFPDAH